MEAKMANQFGDKSIYVGKLHSLSGADIRIHDEV